MATLRNALGLTGFTLLSWAAVACFRGAPATDLQWIQSEAPIAHELPRRVETGQAARGGKSPQRGFGQPAPWNGGSVLPFKTERDRSAARERSLAQRALRRAFEGAPPVMPHSASFGAGSKQCLDCHTNGMILGDRVAHPMSHAPMASCTQCHVESYSRNLPPPAFFANAFVGDRGRAPAERRFAGVPPAIPHGISMRNRCLSCHGEFGYPGLRTSHPERALCVQCHLVDDAVDSGAPWAQ